METIVVVETTAEVTIEEVDTKSYFLYCIKEPLVFTSGFFITVNNNF